MFVTAQQLEQQMPDATRLLSDEPEMETSLHLLGFYRTDTGEKLLIPTELAEQLEKERQRADAQQQRAEAERDRANHRL